jgi:signal transduction histidine kinase
MIQFGFLRSVELLTDQINLKGKLQITLLNEADDLGKLDRLRNLVLYRIIQEKLNNVMQHAQATMVKIHIQSDGKNILLSIADNGVGFDMRQSKPGSSLQKIKSRVEYYNGKMQIDSAPGKGCVLNISIPIQWFEE